MPLFIECQSLERIPALDGRLALPHEPTQFSPCFETEAKLATFKTGLGTPAHAKRKTHKGSP